MPTQNDIERYIENLQGEVDGSYLYRQLAEAENRPKLADLYRQIAEVEEKHGKFWADHIRTAGGIVPTLRPSWRSRALGWLAKRFGTQFVLSTVVSMESSDSEGYSLQPESKDSSLPADEAAHRKTIETILQGSTEGLEGSSIAQLEGRHRAMGGNALRAAVLGSNDGLVSNLSLVMGVSGAELATHSILITGLAGLLAGAISMALGEWLSVQSSRELYSRQIKIEEAELKAHPEEEEEELFLIYQAKGLSKEQARQLAKKIISNKDTALDTLAREELGIDPTELGGSAWEAAFTSFFLFGIGAIIPVFPFFFTTGKMAVLLSILFSSAGLFGIGSLITLMTGRSPLISGFRQMMFGLSAAAVTYGIGWLLGVSLGG